MSITMTSRSLSMILTLSVVFSLLACIGGQEDDDDNNDSSQPATCMEASFIEAGAFIDLDRSCSQDSDCVMVQAGTCGCSAPVNKDGDIAGYEASREDTQRLCSEEETTDCTQVTCDFDPQNVSCNMAGRCIAPAEQ